MELDAVEREKWLGAVIAQLHSDNANLQALVHPDTSLEQVSERKSTIQDVVTQLEEMGQEAKKVT